MMFPNYTWNGPICPTCGRGYTQQTWGTSTKLTVATPYVPKHRKPGPAQ